MPPRKRFSAFDDFPGEEQPSGTPAPLAPLGPAETPAEMERIERLAPSQMLPDRFQPRRLLPAGLRAAFFNGKLDCYQAAAEWLSLARADPAQHVEVERLLAMGDSFGEHGQIKAITGAWVSAPGGQYRFQIETGERRFWAACLQRVATRAAAEPLLRVEVVPAPTRQRQVLENRHAEPPSAVGQACEVAALILAELKITPDPAVEDEFEYFRQARAQRMPAGLWDRLMPIMQLTRPRMVQLLNILQLPSHLLELADRHRLPERVLREVLSAPAQAWERTLRASIQNQLTSDEVAELTAAAPLAPSQAAAHPRQTEARPPMDPSRQALRSLRRFAFTIADLDEFGQAQALDEIADALIVSNQADGMVVLLGELARMLEARITRRAQQGKR